MSTLLDVPLSQLSQSELNVRRTDGGADIEGLAASIAAHGLLQNLSVVPANNGRFKVIAGGRRLRALKLLVKTGKLAKDWPVPCRIGDEAEATEQSLAENVHRVAMNPMDEVEAFEALARENKGADAIAQRFGVAIRHVEQRLALAALSPKIRAAYRKGDLTLDVARAFCIAPDHAAQERVFKSFAKPISHAQSVRAALTQGRMSAADRLVRFVGIENYETAGGRVTRDLFEDDQIYLDDGDLVHRLAGEKLEAIRLATLSEGWGWAEIQTGFMQIEGCASERLSPIMKKPSAKAAKAIATLKNEIDDLDNQIEALEEDEANALWDRRDAAELELSRLQEALRTWDTKQMALAGAAISIDRDGSVLITRGLIKRSDLKSLAKLRASPARASQDDDDDNSPPPSSPGGALPQTLTEKLTSYRTCALRAEIAHAPHTALALLVHAFTLQRQSGHAPAGIGVRWVNHAFAEHDRLQTALSLLERDAPPSLEAAQAMSTDALLAILAILVAETLNFSHRGAGAHDAALQAGADALARLVDLDMKTSWRADAEFWNAAPKALAVSALEAAPKYVRMSPNVRAAALAKIAKLKKRELSELAEAELAPLGWLPEVLQTRPVNNSANAPANAA